MINDRKMINGGQKMTSHAWCMSCLCIYDIFMVLANPEINDIMMISVGQKIHSHAWCMLRLCVHELADPV